ncbi:MAG TPA: M23 family metallopeptidase, partial [Brevundimonas sp.]|nr:M23 family metallopeptidase [Brevundimonas sp.]
MQQFDPRRPYQPAQGGTFDPARPFTLAPTLNRPPLERAGENIKDAWERSGAGSLQRRLDPQNDGVNPVADFFLTPQILEGGNTDRVLDATLGRDRGYLRSVTDETRRSAPMIAQERARREQYDARAAADPIKGPLDAAGFFAGQVAGSALSPESWIAPGKQVLTRLAGNAAAGAGTDALLQGNDIGAGVQDNYSPTQTLVAGGVGGLIQGGFELGSAGARRAAPAVNAGRRATSAAFDYGRWAAGNVSASVRSGLANPVPRFDGPAMDLGEAVTPRGAAPSPLGDFGQPRRARAAEASSPGAPEAVAFVAPVNGPVSSGFGPRRRPNARASANHRGMDFAVPEGTPVAAAAGGEVIFAGTRGNYGNRVVIRHANGTESAYSHLSGFGVRVGDRVSAGQTVARSGSSGNVTGPHLHFEITRGGQFVNPASVLDDEAAPPLAASRSTPDAGSSIASEPLIRSRGPEAGPLSPDPLLSRYGDRYTAEDIAQARRAATEPEAADALRAMLAERLPTQRQARNATRALIAAARRNPLPAEPETVSPAALADGEASVSTFNPSKPFTAVDGPAPAVLAARAGFDPTRPFIRSASPDAVPERLAIDMSNYAGRIGQQSGQALPSSGQAQPGGLRGAPRPGAVPVGKGVEFRGKTVSDLAADLRSTLGLTARQGRVGMKGALGTYDRGSGVIRTQAVDDLDVLAHEATHALEYLRAGPALLAAMKANAKELKALDYEPAKARRHEGFAEFGRWYLTNPDHARRLAPGFYDAF